MEPRVSPNDVALELFREMGETVRRIDDKLDRAREELAEVRGAEIPESLRAQANLLREHHDRLNRLEENARTAEAVSRPWWWAARRAAESVITALVGAVGAVLAIKGFHS